MGSRVDRPPGESGTATCQMFARSILLGVQQDPGLASAGPQPAHRDRLPDLERFHQIFSPGLALDDRPRRGQVGHECHGLAAPVDQVASHRMSSIRSGFSARSGVRMRRGHNGLTRARRHHCGVEGWMAPTRPTLMAPGSKEAPARPGTPLRDPSRTPRPPARNPRNSRAGRSYRPHRTRERRDDPGWMRNRMMTHTRRTRGFRVHLPARSLIRDYIRRSPESSPRDRPPREVAGGANAWDGPRWDSSGAVARPC